MNNGQMNIAPAQTVMQLVTQDSNVPAAVTTDGAEQNTGIFAGVLNGIQHVAKGNDLSGTGQTEQLPHKPDKLHPQPDAGAEGAAVDLLAQLNVLSDNTPTPEPAVSGPDESQKTDISAGAVPVSSKPSEVASQMAMAAYLQPGKMPEVNIPTQSPVDMLQNVAVLAAQPVQAVAEPLPAPQAAVSLQMGAAKAPVPASSPELAASGIMAVNTQAQPAVDLLHNVASALTQPAVIAAPAVEMQTGQVAAKALQTSQVITPVQFGATPASSPQPVASDRMPEVNISTPLAVDGVLNAAAPAHPADRQSEQTVAEMLQASQAATSVQLGSAKDSTPASPQPVTSDRMSEVNISTPLAVDGVPNAAVPAQPAVISAPAVGTQPEQDVAKLRQASQISTQAQSGSVKASTPSFSPQPAASDKMPEVSISMSLPVERLQNAVSVQSQPAVISAPAVKIQPAQAVARFLEASQVITPTQSGSAKESAPASSPQPAAPMPLAVDGQQNVASAAQPVIFAPTAGVPPEQTVATLQMVQAVTPDQLNAAKESPPVSSPQPAASDRTLAANIPTSPAVDGLQNVASVTDQPAPISASPDKAQVAQTVAAAATETPSPLTASNGNSGVQGTGKSDLAAKPTVASAGSNAAQSELPGPVVEQLSQPQPIADRITSEPAVAGNTSVGLVPETRSSRQRFTTEQQIEKVGTGNEPSAVKEMVASLHSATSDGESALDSDTQHGSNSNKGESGSTSDNQVLAQQMPGQLSTEHLKVAVLDKGVPAEPVRQNISEQVVQQVKESLAQQDVKPGSQQITLTLSPDSLGEVKMNLNLQGQKLSVEIVTENRTVRDAIIQHTGALKESLARQNITMESFDVTTSGGTGSAEPECLA